MPSLPYPNVRLGRLTAVLEAAYGRQQRWSQKPPMDQLLATILSQRTNYADERQAFNNLLERFGDWAGVAAARVEDIEAEIQTTRYPEVKAPRIKEILAFIIADRGACNLDHLYDLSVEEADAYMRALPGVGPKTSTFVQLFSMRRPVLPVDTHVHRTTTRLGIIPAKTSQAKAHVLLLEMIPRDAGEILNFHKLYFKLGQRVCHYARPACERCPLNHDCDYARAHGRATQRDAGAAVAKTEPTERSSSDSVPASDRGAAAAAKTTHATRKPLGRVDVGTRSPGTETGGTTEHGRRVARPAATQADLFS